MRWDDLFADLEGEAEGLVLRARDDQIVERTRSELSRIRLTDRLNAAIGTELTVRVAPGDVTLVRGTLRRVTLEWLLLTAPGIDWLVASAAITGVRGLTPSAQTEGASVLDGRLAWGSPWRALARDAAPVRVTCRDGAVIEGVPARVGADFVELAQRGSDRPHRDRTRSYEVVPFAALVTVRCPGSPPAPDDRA